MSGVSIEHAFAACFVRCGMSRLATSAPAAILIEPSVCSRTSDGKIFINTPALY
jgi:hypothetical protein